MSKAIDKVWHEGLIFKLEQNNNEGKLLDFVENHLSNRKQRVVLNGMESKWGEIRAGVPQGPELDPLLFLRGRSFLIPGTRSDRLLEGCQSFKEKKGF